MALSNTNTVQNVNDLLYITDWMVQPIIFIGYLGLTFFASVIFWKVERSRYMIYALLFSAFFLIFDTTVVSDLKFSFNLGNNQWDGEPNMEMFAGGAMALLMALLTSINMLVIRHYIVKKRNENM
jgi:hypothetical protein